MTKNNATTHLPIHNESLLDHPLFQIIQQNARWILYGVLFLLLLLVLIYRILSSQSARAEKDFIQAEQEITLLDQPDKKEEALKNLKNILYAHPELNPLYEGVMAQELLNQGDLTEAFPLANQALNRVKGRLSSEYEAFSHTTLAIADKQFSDALIQAYQLKELLLAKTLPKDSPLNTLYAFNLLRIAFLEKELKHKELEKRAWDELNQMATGTHQKIKIAPIEIQRIMTHFDEQGAKLKDLLKE